ADRSLGYSLHLHWDAFELRQHDILDVVDVPALREIAASAAVKQSDGADVHRLLADGDLAAADIDIGVAERADDLRDRDIVGVEFIEIDLDIVLLGRTAPRIYCHHARHSEEAPSDDPVLYGAQIGQPEVRRADDLIAIDLADQTGLLNERHLAAGQADILLQADLRLLVGEEIIDAVFERDADK